MFTVLIWLAGAAARADDPLHPPEQVLVLPVFFVAQDAEPPSPDQIDRLARHLRWSQDTFRRFLDGRSTFRIADRPPLIFHSAQNLAYYRAPGRPYAELMIDNLLTTVGHTRFDNPYVFVIVFMNSDDDFPTGGGRPLNGGYNTGGGLVLLSSYALDRHRMLQSTLRHEIGHAYGLPHVDVYAYDMATNPSVMSYNAAHWTDFFEEAADPGRFIPEDIRGLAMNDRGFAGLTFDVPPGYEIFPWAVWLGPMEFPGRPTYGVALRSDDIPTYGTSLDSLVWNQIWPSAGPGVRFDVGNMWNSASGAPGAWSEIDVRFPLAARLSRITVHSEHSGRYHRAQALEVLVKGAGGFEAVADVENPEADQSLSFAARRAQAWRLRLRRGESGYVTLRGLRFFDGDVEILPKMVP
jgi:hypothetical protein